MFGVVTRRKSVLLNDNVKARIISSGSGHGYDDVTASPTFSELIFGGESCGAVKAQKHDSDDSDGDSSLHETIKPIRLDYTDEFQNVLRAHVLHALQLQMLCCVKTDKSAIRRNVMGILRDRGYDAAICNTKWEKSGGLAAGNYEFIEVLSPETRYFVDLEFAPEFEIARATTSYDRLLQYLPVIFVGKIEEMKLILKAMSDAARLSLKIRGLHLPPWRKHRFLQNKWLGTYRRTTNILPVVKQSSAIKCRAVGFTSVAAV